MEVVSLSGMSITIPSAKISQLARSDNSVSVLSLKTEIVATLARNESAANAIATASSRDENTRNVAGTLQRHGIDVEVLLDESRVLQNSESVLVDTLLDRGIFWQFVIAEQPHIYSAGDSAFAAVRKSDGALFAWGHPKFGGDCSKVAEELKGDVERIHSTDRAFVAVRKSDGALFSWGNPLFGGDCSEVAAALKGDVETIEGSDRFFVAIRKSDGELFAWGNQEFCVVNSWTQVVERLKLANVGIVQSAGLGHFVVTRRHDGPWLPLTSRWFGDWRGHSYGNEVVQQLKEVERDIDSVHSNGRAFVAIRKSNGALFAWGDPQHGGDCSAVAEELKGDVNSIHMSDSAFVAIRRSDGAIFAWGDPGLGGDCRKVAAELKGDVCRIFSNRSAFVAVRKSDGAIFGWGDSEFGGDCSSVAAALKGDIAAELKGDILGSV